MTEETMTITVGQPLDITPSEEGYEPILNGPCFDIIAFYSGITQADIDDWLHGQILHGIYVEKSIPIFILDLGRNWSLDVYLNILGEREKFRRKFFEGDPNDTKMHLILTSFPDTIVQGIRTIAIDPNLLKDIKEACFHQLSRYGSKEECQEAAEEIMDKWSSQALRELLSE
jgi:hypothetical protein